MTRAALSRCGLTGTFSSANGGAMGESSVRSFPQIIQKHPISGCAFVLPERPTVASRSLEGVLPCKRRRREMFSVTPNQAGLTHITIKIFTLVAGAQFQLTIYVFGQHRFSADCFGNSLFTEHKPGLLAEEVAEFEAHLRIPIAFEPTT